MGLCVGGPAHSAPPLCVSYNGLSVDWTVNGCLLSALLVVLRSSCAPPPVAGASALLHTQHNSTTRMRVRCAGARARLR